MTSSGLLEVVKGSAGGAVKWFAPFTSGSLSVRAKVRCSSNLALASHQPCDGTLKLASWKGSISGM